MFAMASKVALLAKPVVVSLGPGVPLVTDVSPRVTNVALENGWSQIGIFHLYLLLASLDYYERNVVSSSPAWRG